jgi:hypothetical protein
MPGPSPELLGLVEEVYGILDLSRAYRDAHARPGFAEAFARARTHPDRAERDAIEWALLERAVVATKDDLAAAHVAGRAEYGPWPKTAATRVARLHHQGLGRTRIAAETGIPERQVRYIVEALRIRRLILDDENVLLAGPGWITQSDPGGRTIRLKRL